MATAVAEGLEVGEDGEGTEVDTVVATVAILHIEEGKAHHSEVCMFKGTKV